jgi:plastocyanin
MVRKLLAIGVAAAALAAGACGGRGSSGGGAGGVDVVMLPQVDPDLVVFATVPKDTIGEELPGEGLGSIKSVKWRATLGGFTQQRYSQSLGLRPHTKITILNLSKSVTHTLDVVKEISGPPADFPKDPNLSIKEKGGGKLETGYASGPIKPGKSVTVTLVKAGTYLIGCAFHYKYGMRDVLVIEPHAAKGPQATPTPKPTSPPTSRSSYDP